MRPTPQRFRPVVHLSRRVFAPLQRLARLAGVSCSEVVELVLEDLFHDEVARPVDQSARRGERSGRRPATVTPISRARDARSEIPARPRQARDEAAAARARERARRVRRMIGVLG